MLLFANIDITYVHTVQGVFDVVLLSNSKVGCKAALWPTLMLFSLSVCLSEVMSRVGVKLVYGNPTGCCKGNIAANRIRSLEAPTSIIERTFTGACSFEMISLMGP